MGYSGSRECDPMSRDISEEMRRDEIADEWQRRQSLMAECTEQLEAGARAIRAGISEINRLRSDEWLEKALVEIMDRRPFGPPEFVLGMALDVMRKHRDGLK